VAGKVMFSSATLSTPATITLRTAMNDVFSAGILIFISVHY
jgi:hypothetical protein